MNRHIVRFCVVAFLLLPYLFLFFRIDKWTLPNMQEVAEVFSFTTAQALLAAIFSVVVGFWGALGLLSLRVRRPLVEVIFVLPASVPPLFSLLSILKVIQPFPWGFWGIILVQTILNSGVVAVMFARLFETKISGWAELAWIEGASKSQFLPVVIRYLWRDIALVALFVFSICFSGLTVPMIVGGFSGTTIEVLIMEKIRLEGEFSQALGLSFIQTIFVLAVAWPLAQQSTTLKLRNLNVPLVQDRIGLLLPGIFTLILVLGQLTGWPQGLDQIGKIESLSELLPEAIKASISVTIGCGLILALLMLAVAGVAPHERFQKFLVGFVAPSTVLTGFVFLVLLGSAPRFGMAAGIALLSFPLLYRMELDGILNALKSQIEVARVLGADWMTVFREIVVPQTAGPIGFLAGLGAFWACGDFGLSSVVAGSDKTLALLVKDLVSSYRFEAATVLLWPVLLLGILVWFGFWRLGLVLSRKSFS